MTSQPEARIAKAISRPACDDKSALIVTLRGRGRTRLIPCSFGSSELCEYGPIYKVRFGSMNLRERNQPE